LGLIFFIIVFLNDGFFYQNIDKTNPRFKEDRTVLTEADLAADRFLTQAIQAAFPEDYILSEEMNTQAPMTGQPVWVIDPLDGTTNFSLGVHYWGVSIARVVNGWPETAAVYFPVIDELYTAQRGAGSFLNGDRLKTTPFDPSLPNLFFCCSRTYQHYRVKLRIKHRILGAAAYNFCAIASGRAKVGFEVTPKLWDIAAGGLLIDAPHPRQDRIGARIEGRLA